MFSVNHCCIDFTALLSFFIRIFSNHFKHVNCEFLRLNGRYCTQFFELRETSDASLLRFSFLLKEIGGKSRNYYAPLTNGIR